MSRYEWLTVSCSEIREKRIMEAIQKEAVDMLTKYWKENPMDDQFGYVLVGRGNQ
jgi:hypothetical protein